MQVFAQKDRGPQPGRQAGLNEDMVAWANLKQLTDVPDGYDLSKAEAKEV